MNYVISPLKETELKKFFDKDSIKVIEYFLKKSMISQPEKVLNQENDLPIQIPKEHIEQWVVQALGAKPAGAGSYPIDVRTEEWGADIKMLSCKIDKNGSLKNSDSGETSLAQKFSDDNFGDGNNLDKLFTDKKFDFIWKKWQEIILNKYQKVEDDFGINKIYYFIILRAGTVFHLCGLKVNLSLLETASINNERSTNDSIWIKNFIEDEYGHVKIYKAKKRLELRLKPLKWVNDNLVITFNTNFHQPTANILDLVKNKELDKYIENEIMPILKPKQH